MSGRYSVLLNNKPASPPLTADQPNREKPPITSPATVFPKQESKQREIDPLPETHANENDSMTARQQDGRLSSRHDGPPPRQQADMTIQLSPLRTLLNDKDTEKTTVRLPQELVRYLEDTLYRIKRGQNVKFSMKAIIIATVASFCLEFEEQGTDSPLYKKLVDESE